MAGDGKDFDAEEVGAEHAGGKADKPGGEGWFGEVAGGGVHQPRPILGFVGREAIGSEPGEIGDTDNEKQDGERDDDV